MKKIILNIAYFFLGFLFTFLSLLLLPYIFSPIEELLPTSSDLISELMVIPYFLLISFLAFKLIKSSKRMLGFGIATGIIFVFLQIISSIF